MNTLSLQSHGIARRSARSALPVAGKALLLVVLAVCILYPFFWVIFGSFRSEQGWTLAHYWEALSPFYLRVISTTLVYAVGHRDSPNPLDTEIEDKFSPAPIAGYARVDVAFAYHFGGPLAPLSVTATARNLFNRDYAQSIGFPAPPARFLAGLRYGF